MAAEHHIGISVAARPPSLEPLISKVRIVLASLVGTAIEFYDFYIYGTAAALVIGQTFFPQSAPGAQALNAFLTFGIAFLSRSPGAAHLAIGGTPAGTGRVGNST